MIIDTSKLNPNNTNQQVYNGLDCCITFEVWEVLNKFPKPQVYDFARAMQAPALEMMLRGFLVDQEAKEKIIKELEIEILRAQEILNKFAIVVWNKPLNSNSPKQLLDFFYKHMRLPEVWVSIGGEKKLSMNLETLEKLSIYLYAKPFVSLITTIRDLRKQLSVLNTKIDPDGRMRTSYNIVGTETGRWSSSTSSEGTGTNMQNISPKLRHIFVADPGWKICGIDGEQAESREVGWIMGTILNDWSYLNMCESGDLHTAVCKMIWPGLPWTGDSFKDQKMADGDKFYRDFTRRDATKRLGHGSNYMGTAWTMARKTKIPQNLVEEFQQKYFALFPFRKWFQYVAGELGSKRCITNTFGRTRQFFGRPNDDNTLREAIAYGPQSGVGDYTNLALWRIWYYLPEVQVLAQLHDAIYFQYKESSDENRIISRALELFKTTRRISNRSFTIPGEAKIGWNWGIYVDKEEIDQAIDRGEVPPKLNLKGLKKWKPS